MLYAVIPFEYPHNCKTTGIFEKLKSLLMYNVSIPSLMSVAENVFQEFIGHIIYIILYYFEFNLEKVILKQKLKTVCR